MAATPSRALCEAGWSEPGEASRRPLFSFSVPLGVTPGRPHLMYRAGTFWPALFPATTTGGFGRPLPYGHVRANDRTIANSAVYVGDDRVGWALSCLGLLPS